jgi:hypothetical protein
VQVGVDEARQQELALLRHGSGDAVFGQELLRIITASQQQAKR